MAADIPNYSFRVFFSPEDREWVATCAEMPGLSWLAGSPAKALRGLEGVIKEVIEDMHSTGEPIPVPFVDRIYSGKFNVRVGQEMHRQLVERAAETGMSLNTFVLTCLTQGVESAVERAYAAELVKETQVPRSAASGRKRTLAGK